jgi:hypothetical protein
LARFTFALGAVAAISIVAFGAAACGDDNDTAEGDSSASQASIDEVTARVQRNEMLYSTIAISNLGLHGMDEHLNQERTIEGSFVPNTRAAIRLFALTDWDSDLKDDAEALEATAVELLKALQDEDIDAAAAAATELHESEHDFSNEVWAILAADLPADAGGVEAHDAGGASGTPEGDGDGGHGDGGEETPATESTP